MVDPNYLATQVIIPLPVRLRFLNANHPTALKLLGESGQRMARDGAHFIFTRPLADELIAVGAAEEAI